jgi:hypothetical protein
MKTIINLALVGMILLTGCKKTDMQAPAAAGTKSNAGMSTKGNLSSTNGSAGIELIYYDAQLFKMNLYQLSAQAAASQLAHNKSINILYEAEGFVTVTDAIQADGYNPVWQEVDIVFNTGFTPHQFLSDTEVESAAAGTNPEITLVPTDEVYRCDILQHTKTQ